MTNQEKYDLATNPNTPVEKYDLATNPNTPVDILVVLSRDQDFHVRSHVARNPNNK